MIVSKLCNINFVLNSNMMLVLLFCRYVWQNIFLATDLVVLFIVLRISHQLYFFVDHIKSNLQEHAMQKGNKQTNKKNCVICLRYFITVIAYYKKEEN